MARNLNRLCVLGAATGALALALAGGAVAAEVKVNFLDSEHYSDIKDNDGFRHPEVLKDLEAHLLKLVQSHLPGRDVLIEVLDVDLAGFVEPFGHSGRWIRVMRNVTPPAVELRYEVREAGKVVRSGSAKLRDLDYQNGLSRYFSSEPLRYEFQMLDRWFDEEFGAVSGKTRVK
jgi:Protein of unknown function (DUF3016)